MINSSSERDAVARGARTRHAHRASAIAEARLRCGARTRHAHRASACAEDTVTLWGAHTSRAPCRGLAVARLHAQLMRGYSWE